MRNYLILASISLSLLLACQQTNTDSQQTFEVISNEKTLQLDTLYSELFENKQFNGNVLVAEGGAIIYQKSFGLANEAEGRELNLETAFELASVSKQFTAMGIVLLQKAGKLSYEDDISTYIPELKSYEGITLQHLLTHTGGLSDYMDLADEQWDKSKIATNDDIIQLYHELQPEKDFEPNTEWDYSNTGYLLLATIIERVSGQSFGMYLKEQIFEPLGMENTFVYRRRYKPEEIENYADGYIYSDSLEKKILPDEMGQDFYVVFLDGIVGDGMVNSNLYDLLKWDRALYRNQLVNEADKEKIFSSYQTLDSTETDYGFGWNIREFPEYQKIVSHSGGWAGYLTYIERHLDNDKTIIILQNNATQEIEMPIKNTRRILYGLPVKKPITLSTEVLMSYAGTYINESGKERHVIFESDKLWIPMNPEVKLELIAVSETKFIVDGFSPEVSYTFIINEGGEIEKYRVQQAGTGLDAIATRKK